MEYLYPQMVNGQNDLTTKHINTIGSANTGYLIPGRVEPQTETRVILELAPFQTVIVISSKDSERCSALRPYTELFRLFTGELAGNDHTITQG